MNPANPPSANYDVIIVGSGAAGLYACLCLPENYRVCLISKESLKTGASDWAQGGIAAAIGGQDSPRLHYEDTLKAGVGLCDPRAVEFLVNQANSAIKSLVDLGVSFDRQGDNLAMTLEAAHSRPRVLHAADQTGRAIVTTLMEKVQERPNTHIIPNSLALKLWIEDGRCQGIALLYEQKISWIGARAVILATGGGGQVYAQTTNPAVSTGDGVALAWRSGAVVRDLEFFQFHPTALSVPGAPRFLISEAVRGEGAHLVDSRGERFAFNYHPAGELAPRDVVSRAIFHHLAKTSPNPAIDRVYLDLKPIPEEKIRHRFPNIIRVCQKWGVDVFNDLIPVTPAAHYWMGGIETGLDNQTSIPGLYAIGEVASTGVQGANRLASNSLLECLVFAGQLRHLQLPSWELERKEKKETLITEELPEEKEFIETLRRDLPILMWQNASISRQEEALSEALIQVEEWREKVKGLKIVRSIEQIEPGRSLLLASDSSERQLKICQETLNLLDVSYLILKSALFRQESRGGHYRSDFPDTETQWLVHTTIQGYNWIKQTI